MRDGNVKQGKSGFSFHGSGPVSGRGPGPPGLDLALQTLQETMNGSGKNHSTHSTGVGALAPPRQMGLSRQRFVPPLKDQPNDDRSDGNSTQAYRGNSHGSGHADSAPEAENVP